MVGVTTSKQERWKRDGGGTAVKKQMHGAIAVHMLILATPLKRWTEVCKPSFDFAVGQSASYRGRCSRTFECLLCSPARVTAHGVVKEEKEAKSDVDI